MRSEISENMLYVGMHFPPAVLDVIDQLIKAQFISHRPSFIRHAVLNELIRMGLQFDLEGRPYFIPERLRQFMEGQK